MGIPIQYLGVMNLKHIVILILVSMSKNDEKDIIISCFNKIEGTSKTEQDRLNG